ncbi:unnamed protein product [Spirodela intermedia]|uniref:Uncharacterized protein n=1 Tax=Spirodela intermedia TaxID=51605 RepID=A0A7I8JHG2_SPIIN|nr:unnamed protein product [Spirodela intermedia]CAA6669600.1 unnamed protein product [Spirodela intermedia]
MASEAAEDVWGDEDFLNALILATENATAAAASSSGGYLARRAPGDGVPASSRSHAISSTSSWVDAILKKVLNFIIPKPLESKQTLLILQLLECCSADLCTLFRFTGVPSNLKMDFMTNEKFTDVGLDDLKHSIQSAEAHKVSHLYSIMMKVLTYGIIFKNKLYQFDNEV